MLITNTEPKSYASVGEIKVKDRKGKLFYYFPGPGLHTFNLPRGTYSINDGAIVFEQQEFTPNPEIEDCMHISTAYRGMTVEVENNPNKASFFPHANHCKMDPDIATHAYEPCTIACLNHEEGHTDIRSGPGYPLSFEDAEHFCDCYSYNKMVKNGYNSKQAELAFELLLDASNPRVSRLKNKIAIANGNGLPEASPFMSIELPYKYV